MIEIAQGEDFFFNISESDAQGSLVNLDLYPDIKAYLYVEYDKPIRYSLSDLTGYHPIIKVTSQQYRIKLYSEDSKLLVPGELTFEVLILDPTERTIFKGQIAIVVKSKIKREIQ